MVTLFLMKMSFCCKYAASKVFSALVCGLIFVVFLLAPQAGCAHPHAFIAQQFEMVFDAKGLAGIRVRWKFDDMFANMIAEDFDLNRTGSLEKNEVKDVEKEAFSNLAEYSFFIFVEIEGKPFEVKYVRDFNAILNDGELTYEFLIPCHVTAIERFKKVAVSGYDPTYYTAINFSAEHPILLTSADGFEVKTAIRENPDIKYYFDMIHPWTLFLEFRKEP